MAKAVVTFATYQGGQLVSRDSVTHDIVKVGRDPKSHLRVEDPAASRMHAVIEVASPSEITLIDLGNDPGTYVNGERINKCRLRVGDRIDIGSTQLILENVEADNAGRFDARQALGAAVARATDHGHSGYAEPTAAPATPAYGGGVPSASYAAQAAYNPHGTMAGGVHAPPSQVGRPSSPGSHGMGRGAQGHGGHGHGHGGGSGGNYTYAMVKSGPDVTPDEVELPHVQAAEVMILWGTNVLHVAHLSPPRNFYVGEEQSK
ncbi:MAG: hypothetical protein RL685_5178, partial [Pseudomonadota bacterium]